jgi:hypothetical protein
MWQNSYEACGKFHIEAPKLLAKGGRFATQIIRRVGLHSALVTGPALVVLGSVLMARITPVDGALWVTLGYMLVGIGLVCALVTLTIAVRLKQSSFLLDQAFGLWSRSRRKFPVEEAACTCRLNQVY